MSWSSIYSASLSVVKQCIILLLDHVICNSVIGLIADADTPEHKKLQFMKLIMNSYKYFKQEDSRTTKNNMNVLNDKLLKGVYLFAKDRQKNIALLKKDVTQKY